MSSLSGGTDNPGPDGKSATPFIHALCEAMVFEDSAALGEAVRIKTMNWVADFVQGQLNSLPLPLRALFEAGMAGFRLFVRIRHFRSFVQLPVEQRTRIISGWAWGRVALFRQLLRVLRSTVFLAFFETPELRSALEAQTPAAPAEVGTR